jgi:hypothetical protein
MAISVPVSAERPKLIDYLEGAYPSYFIYGPLVFSPATENIISALAGNANSGAPLLAHLSQRNSPLFTRRGDRPAFEGEELVMVPSPFFPHKLAKGFSNPFGRVVKSINDVPVKNLLHLVQLLRDSTEPFTVIEFGGLGTESLVFPHREAVAVTDEILTDNGVRGQGSADTLVVWNATSR